MRKKTVLVLTAVAVSAAMMVGCNSTSGQESSPGSQSVASQSTSASTELANPWTESDQQGVATATGFEMTAPEGATDVVYSYMKDGALAQMSYTLDDATWTYRMQATDELTDISGLNYEWTLTEDGTVSGLEAVYYTYSDGDLNKTIFDDVQMVNWYDAVTGVSYSLSATRSDLNGMDIQVYAENLYVPLQGDATDDSEKDRETELKDYFLGEHKRSSDESTLTISDNGDGTFKVDLSIVRLCSLEDGVGTFEDHKMNFEVEDPSGNPMSGVIYRDSDNSLTVKIVNSSWGYLANDEVLEGFGK